jgi:NADPH:quinone reductase-like Zn-dependent oxidoreductase
VACNADFTCPVPDSIPLENAGVLPLSVSTSAAALFMKTFLGLPTPTTSPSPNGKKAILVWGASGSVGGSGVQFGRAAGLTVVATSSPRSFDYVKSLGAEEVFNYADAEVATKIVEYLKSKQLSLDSVFDSISEGGSVEKSFEVLQKLNGQAGGRYIGVLNVASKPTPAGVKASTGIFCISSVEWEYF